MSFENGLIGLIVALLGMIGNFVFNLLGEEIDDKKLVKKRVKQSLIVGSIFTITYALLIAYTNRNKAEIFSEEENIILLYTFISTTIFFYIIKAIHHLISEKICANTNSKKKKWLKETEIYPINLLTSFSIAIILLLILCIAKIIIVNPKSVTIEDSTISIQKIEYILPKNTTFQFNYVSKNPDGEKNELYEYKYNNTEFVLKKGTCIKLFKNSELYKKESDNLIFKNNEQYADAKLMANKNSVLQLNKGETASLESDVRIKINKIDLNTISTILNCEILALILIFYYILKPIDWSYLKNQLKITSKKTRVKKSK